MLVTAKEQEKIETKLPARATYYSQTDEESDPKVIDYDQLLNLHNTKAEDQVTVETLNPDLLPTDATLRVLHGEPFLKEREERVKAIRSRHRVKGKAMIAVYAAAILTLLLVVILNAVALVRLSVSTAELETEVAEARLEVAELSAYADSLSDPERLIEAAEELGYVLREE